MRAMTRRLTAALVLCGAVAMLVPVVASAFTGTRAAVGLVNEMYAAYRKVPAVSEVLTGDVVYCPAYPEGWTFAPYAGCTTDARVSEEDQLSNGHVVGIIGLVGAPSRPTL